MDTYFVCLANSYKRGGRCIAGVEIDIDGNNHWKVKHKEDGSPKWIRPIAQNTEYGEIPEGEAYLYPLLSVVKITEVIPCSNMAHSEDVNYQRMYTIGRVPSSPIILNKLIDGVHSSVFYTTDFSISIDEYAHGDYSLMMVHPDGLSFRLDPSKNRAKYYMAFKHKGAIYDFSVTDPFFYQYIELYPDALNNLSDVFVTLSLGLEYEGRHHKLIAAIIVPSADSHIKDPFLIRQDILREKSTRAFSLKERRACKRCFVVPSQEGFSVCMKMRNGKDQFMLVDEKCSAKIWQVVNLKKAYLVRYEDADGNEVHRIRVSTTTKESLFKRFTSFFKLRFGLCDYK